MSCGPRIAMILHGYLPQIGGAEKVTAELAEGLADRGFDVHVLARGTRATIVEDTIRGVKIHRIPARGPKYMAAAMTSILSLARLKRLQPDLVHAHTLLSPSLIATAYKRIVRRVPLLVTIHRGGAAPYGEVARHQAKWTGRRRLKLLGRELDRFLAVSVEIERELRTLPGVSPKVILMENGVDPDKIKPLGHQERAGLRRSLEFPDGPVVLFVGRLSPEKRVSLLLDIWPELRTQYPPATLCIIGDGPEADELKARAGEGVQFAGIPRDVIPYLQAGDIFILPSVAEGMSIAMLEAMAAGLPVVATDVGGASQVVTDKYNGFLIKPDDPDGTLDVLGRLLKDVTLRRSLGLSARQTVLDRFNMKSKIDQLARVYSSLLPDDRNSGAEGD